MATQFGRLPPRQPPQLRQDRGHIDAGQSWGVLLGQVQEGAPVVLLAQPHQLLVERKAGVSGGAALFLVLLVLLLLLLLLLLLRY